MTKAEAETMIYQLIDTFVVDEEKDIYFEALETLCSDE